PRGASHLKHESSKSTQARRARERWLCPSLSRRAYVATLCTVTYIKRDHIIGDLSLREIPHVHFRLAAIDPRCRLFPRRRPFPNRCLFGVHAAAALRLASLCSRAARPPA